MGGQNFTPAFAPTKEPPNTRSDGELSALFKDAFRIPTLLALGAGLQIPLSLCLPARWAIVPAAVLVLNAIVKSIIQAMRPQRSDLMNNVVCDRLTTQMPDAATGLAGPVPGDKSFVVFNLGFQNHHPMGLLAPGAGVITETYLSLRREIVERMDEVGCLGLSDWKGTERASNNTMMTTFYFKDVESVHALAHGEIHRRGWEAFQKQDSSCFGVFHETYIVQPNCHETLYVNTVPTGLGKAALKSKTADGERYASLLVSANAPALKSQYSRLNRNESGMPKA